MMNAVFSLLLLVVVGGLTPSPATADVFCDNLKQVADTLPKNTSSSPEHFATATFGQAPDVIYALALCRGDIADDTACSGCLASTFDLILNQTAPPQGQQCFKAAYYYGVCELVFSVNDILAPSNATAANGDDAPISWWNNSTWGNWTGTNITGDAEVVGVTLGLLHQLLLETAEKAAGATTPRRRFATGAMYMYSGAPLPPFYSMAQCTPDLSAGDCLACLNRLFAMVNTSVAMRNGGQIHVIRCFFRYEAYQFYNGAPMLAITLPSPPAPTPTPTPSSETVKEKHKGRLSKFWAIPMVLIPLAAAAFLGFIFYSPWLRTHKKGSRHTQDLHGEEELVWQAKNSEFLVFDFEQLLEATNKFSEENKLGKGGFGAVYKGQLPKGSEIAVKRLASHSGSGQGFMEFKNEVQLIAKLQHRNLVRLLGCCSQEEEKILVYEYLPNKSLDFFIFDENKRALLGWNRRLAIIEGIAHGLVYLHKHSRLCVIHRDLKPSNILLDSEMNPKISDFGLAKIFTSTDTEGSTTRRVVGTYGYMSPEYASEGLFSIKSDVFSFGVVVLEILCGKKNSGSQEYGNFFNLLGYAWQLYEEGRWSELVDASLFSIHHSTEMMRCMNIALLCVQEKAADRPTMLDVVAMLSNKTMVLIEPKHPAYFNLSIGTEDALAVTQPNTTNDMTISITTGR